MSNAQIVGGVTPQSAGRDTDAPCWTLPPALPRPTDQEVHVWKTALNLAPTRVDELAETLSKDERDRVRRYRFERDRRRFIVCRGLLPALLGRYLSAAPRLLEFEYGPNGKPALSAISGARALRFNVSHADETAVEGHDWRLRC